MSGTITPIPINQLPTGTTVTGNEPVPIFQGGRAVQVPVSQLGQGFDQGFVTVGSASPLPNARALAAGDGIIITDNGAGSSISIGATPASPVADHFFLGGLNSGGPAVPAYRQPLFTDISGTAQTSQGGTGANTSAGAASNLGQKVINLTLSPYNLPTGGDDTAAIQAAFDAAALAQVPVYAPAGKYNHTSAVTLTGILLFGDGNSTIFNSTNTSGTNPSNAILLTGDGVGIRNLRITSDWNSTRQANTGSAALVVTAATNYIVDHITINAGAHSIGSASAGILTNNSQYGQETNNIISNTLADGSLHTNGTAFVTINDNKIYNSGDDCISIVSYSADAAGACHNIEENNNVISGGLARGFSVVGGYNISINNFQAFNITGSAIYVGSENAAFVTLGGDNINIGPGLIDGAGSVSPAGASIFVYGRSGNLFTNVNIHDIVAVNLRLIGVQLGNGSDFLSRVEVSNCNLSGVGGTTSKYGVYLNGVDDVKVDGNTLYNFALDGIAANTVNGGSCRILGNLIKQVNTAATVSIRAISISNSGFTSPIIMGNTQVNGSTTIAALVRIGTTETGAVIAFNNGDNTTYSLGTTPVGNIQGLLTLGSANVSGDITGTNSNVIFATAAKGIVLKQGANGKCGTFVCNGATPVTVSNTSIAITDTINVSLNTVGGTVGNRPSVKTITAATGFTIAGDVSDTSTYNYSIISNAA